MALPLDHVVINTHFALDDAARLLQGLGFTLTPTGRHPMGSLNRLAVLHGNYLELIGLPTDGGPLRQEIVDSPLGTDGLVFHTQDADTVYAHQVAQGQAVQPVQAFSRPLTLDGQAREARFRAVRYQAGCFGAGRVYFCEHRTPELIWRPPWQAHPNSARQITGVVIVADDPAAEARAYAIAAQGVAQLQADDAYRLDTPNGTLEILGFDRYRQVYGALACAAHGRPGLFGAIRIAITDGEALAQCLDTPTEGLRVQRQATRTLVRLGAFNTLLDFHVHETNRF